MPAQQQHNVWTFYLSETAGTVPRGKCLVLMEDGLAYVVATSANRAAAGRQAAVLAITAGDGENNRAVEGQFVGVVPNSITGLGAGAAGPIGVSTTGSLERVPLPADDDEIVGRCDEDGVGYLNFATQFELDLTAEIGPTLNNSSSGTISNVVSTADGVPAAAIRFSGSPTVTGIASGVDKRQLVLFAKTGPVTIKNDDPASLEGNRILTGTGEDVEIPVGGAALLAYDPTSLLWSIIAGSGGSSIDIGGEPGEILVKVDDDTIEGLDGSAGQIIRRNDDDDAWEPVDPFDVETPGTPGNMLVYGLDGVSAVDGGPPGGGGADCDEPATTHQVEHQWIDAECTEDPSPNTFVDTFRGESNDLALDDVETEYTLVSFPIPAAAADTVDIYEVDAILLGGDADGRIVSKIALAFEVNDGGTLDEYGLTDSSTKRDEDQFTATLTADANNVNLILFVASPTSRTTNWRWYVQIAKGKSIPDGGGD